MDLLSMVLEHFREYDRWPWHGFNGLERQLAQHPSFVFAEGLFMLLSSFALLHAICEPQGRRLKLIWLATFIVGTVNDYIFMLLPVVDNFWQAQGLVMLTPRMPLYIPCVYNGFMYWSTVAAARVFGHRSRCPLAEASLAGLLAMIFYAPYDLCGAKFLWWTWHDTDPGVALRWLGVPGGSTAWTITFSFCFSLLLRLGHDLGLTELRTLALACGSTPVMLLVLNIFTVLGLDRVGMPGPQTVLAATVCFLGICIRQPQLPWPARAKPLPELPEEHWSVRATLCAYFAALSLIGLLFSPEKQVSTGVHQQFGPCNATDVDLMGYERQRYICRERFPSTYFRLDCSEAGSISPESTMTGGVATWYTVCGRGPVSSMWLAALLSLCFTGALLFLLAFSARGRGLHVEAAKEKESPQSPKVEIQVPDTKLRKRPRGSTPGRPGK